MTFLQTVLRRTAGAFAMLRSANAVAFAVDNNGVPRPDDLRRLGIEPRAFLSIGHG